MDFLNNLLGGGSSDPDTARRDQWLADNSDGSAPTGRTALEDPNAQSSQAGSASGNGGVVGPISAAIGDIGIGGSASADGDNTFNFGDSSFGGGASKVINSGLNIWHVALIGGFALGAIKLMRSK